MGSSTSTSSSTASSTSANDTGDHPHTDRTIGSAVGLGVGVPISLTILVLVWVTIRHHRKMREEDEIHKGIDFNGDVTFWPDETHVMHLNRRNNGPEDDLPKGGSSSNNTDGSTTLTTTSPSKQTEKSRYVADSVPVDAESRISDDTQSLGSRATLRAGHAGNASSSGAHDAFEPHLSMYTPEFMFSQGGSQEHFSKASNSVYGPSPAYPSTEKLRAPSVASLRSQHTGNNAYSVYNQSSYNPSLYNHSTYQGSTYSGHMGPFATPPRHMNASPHSFAFRRMSAGSMAPTEDASSSAGEGDHAMPVQTPVQPQTPALGLVRESPHPYAEMAGEPTVTASQNAVQNDRPSPPAPSSASKSERTSPEFEDAMSHQEPEADAAVIDSADGSRQTRHAYHQEARDRTSQFEFV